MKRNRPYASLSASAKWHRRKSALNIAQGLTTGGKPRQRRPNAGNRWIRTEMRRQRGTQAWNIRVAMLKRIGKTSRGTERVYLMRRGEGIILKSQVEQLARNLAVCFDALSPAAKSAALKLGVTISEIQKQFT